MYYAERKILKALPKMQRAARPTTSRPRSTTSGRPKACRAPAAGVRHHRQARPGRPAMRSRHRRRRRDIIDEFKDTAALDAGLISSAQAVQHTRSPATGPERWATELGMTDAAKLLDATLQESRRRTAT
ncbi:MAG: DUF892 family protein [Geminicoccaceae bacterium]